MLQFVRHVPVSIFSYTRYQYYYASRRPPWCVWGCRHKPWLIPPVCLMTTPALCVHIPCSHCPVRPSRWHSQPRPFVPLSRGLTARSALQCWKPSTRLCFFWLRAPLPVVFTKGVFNLIVSIWCRSSWKKWIKGNKKHHSFYRNGVK